MMRSEGAVQMHLSHGIGEHLTEHSRRAAQWSVSAAAVSCMMPRRETVLRHGFASIHRKMLGQWQGKEV